jgi:hypothetical protein
MNRKDRRRLRRHNNQERYRIIRRHWAKVGPPVVMEDPSEAHVKDLLMEWLVPRAVLDEVTKELASRQTKSLEASMWGFLNNLAVQPSIAAMPKVELWQHLVQASQTTMRLRPQIATV